MISSSSGRFQSLPPGVKNILIINILMFAATVIVLHQTGIDLKNIFGLHWIGATTFRWYQPLTYMFMHGNFEHLLFNMFAVWMFGRSIENIWGLKRFLIFYLCTGVGAAILHYLILYFDYIGPMTTIINGFLAHPDAEHLNVFLNTYGDTYGINVHQFPALNHILHQTASIIDQENAYELIDLFKQTILNQPNVVGASGSLFGILLAFGMMFPNVELFLLFIPIPIKAKYFVAGYGAFELYSGVAQSGDGIAHFAHLGGLITGFILIKLWQRFDSTFHLY